MLITSQVGKSHRSWITVQVDADTRSDAFVDGGGSGLKMEIVKRDKVIYAIELRIDIGDDIGNSDP